MLLVRGVPGEPGVPMLIDITTFSLAAGVEEEAFLAADARLQAALSSRDGFVRRTAARSSRRAAVAGGDDGGGGGGGGGGAQGERWLVLTFWASAEHADCGLAEAARLPGGAARAGAGDEAGDEAGEIAAGGGAVGRGGLSPVAAFDALVDHATVRTERYESLD